MMNSLKQSSASPRSLYAASWGLVCYSIVIIAWGAWVRISGSGDGCGDHWPLCHGRALPIGSPIKTWIEVSHRYSTAVFGILVLSQVWWVRRICPTENRARRWVLYTLVFTITEALIGRSLVKEGLVTDSQEILRAVFMPLHLVNTSLLLLSEVMTAESILYGLRKRVALSPAARWWCVAITISLLVLLTSGAIAALGSHLAPSQSLIQGLLSDVSQQSHAAVRLRIVHPILGLSLPIIIWSVISFAPARGPTGALEKMYQHLGLGVLVMVALGIATLVSLSPTWLKMAHLTMANVLVVMAARCLFHTLRPK
jgi:heme a synthase